MSKLLLSAIALVVLLAPTGVAQTPTHTVTVEIQDLAASGMTNGTSLVVPFKVHAEVAGAPPCLNQDGEATYTIELDAEVTDTTGNDNNATAAHVNPRQVTIAAPVLLPAVGGGARAERTEDATLVINAAPFTGDLLNATVHITATFVSSNGGCTGVGAAPAASDEADFQATFEPVQGFGNTETRGTELPGPAVAVTMLALVALAMIVRRFR